MNKMGSIEVVCGPMFAGKTEELIRRIRRLSYAKKKFLVFKPKIDNRYSSKDEIISHNLTRHQSHIIEKADEILGYNLDGVDAIIIDEVQFFDESIINILQNLADRGIRIIVGGLDTDFKALPFGSMPKILAIADFVTKLTAICPICGEPATRTQRLVNGVPADFNDELILVGSTNVYEPRCRIHHEVKNKK